LTLVGDYICLCVPTHKNLHSLVSTQSIKDYDKMVKIINGEIYQDNDPRLKELLKQRDQQQAQGLAQSQPRQRGVRSLHDPDPSSGM
jgi:hypothetical protein